MAGDRFNPSYVSDKSKSWAFFDLHAAKKNITKSGAFSGEVDITLQEVINAVVKGVSKRIFLFLIMDKHGSTFTSIAIFSKHFSKYIE